MKRAVSFASLAVAYFDPPLNLHVVIYDNKCRESPLPALPAANVHLLVPNVHCDRPPQDPTRLGRQARKDVGREVTKSGRVAHRNSHILKNVQAPGVVTPPC